LEAIEMTDIVERLRSLPPNTLIRDMGDEAADEIERLRKEVRQMTQLHESACESWNATRSELEAVKREAVEALKPFAREANDWDAEANGGFQFADDERADFECSIRVGSLRAARAFVEKHGRDG
jgi:archaellum component FlaC